MSSDLRQFCTDTVAMLATAGPDWGRVYVERTLQLYGTFKYSPGLPKFGLFSSLHGPEFFSTIIQCLDGEEWLEKGEYGENFRKFIRHYRANPT